MRSVKVGVTLKMYDYGTYRPKPIAEIADQARRAEDLGFDTAWVMDHLFIQRPTGRILSHEPMLCLAHAAAKTKSITLGTLVLCHPFRHAVQLAREASALADASGGRSPRRSGSPEKSRWSWSRRRLSASRSRPDPTAS